MELLDRYDDEDSPGWRPGVYCPEEIVNDVEEREKVLRRLTSTPGTFTFELSSKK